MGWMKAIATDVEELVMEVHDSEDPGELGEIIRAQGWVSPTEAGLAAGLIHGILPTVPDPEHVAILRRILGIIRGE